MLKDLLRPRVCELGKIKIGGLGDEKTSTKGKKYRLPRKDDHFTITTLERNKTGDLVSDSALMAELKPFTDKDGKLRQLPIFVLSDDPEEIMQCSWVWYGGKRVSARSDGKRVTWFADRKTGKTLPHPVEEDWQPEYALLTQANESLLFKLHVTFNCVIAAKEARWGGVYKLRTTSRISGDQLYGSLLHILELTRGILRGIPLRLVVRPIQVAPSGIITTVYVVHCELRGPDLIGIQQLALQIADYQTRNTEQVAQYKKLLALPPGTGESDEEIEAIEAEFHPTETDMPPVGRVHEVTPRTDEPHDAPHEEKPNVTVESVLAEMEVAGIAKNKLILVLAKNGYKGQLPDAPAEKLIAARVALGLGAAGPVAPKETPDPSPMCDACGEIAVAESGALCSDCATAAAAAQTEDAEHGDTESAAPNRTVPDDYDNLVKIIVDFPPSTVATTWQQMREENKKLSASIETALSQASKPGRAAAMPHLRILVQRLRQTPGGEEHASSLSTA